MPHRRTDEVKVDLLSTNGCKQIFFNQPAESKVTWTLQPTPTGTSKHRNYIVRLLTYVHVLFRATFALHDHEAGRVCGQGSHNHGKFLRVAIRSQKHSSPCNEWLVCQGFAVGDHLVLLGFKVIFLTQL